MKKKFSLKFLSEICNNSSLQEKFLDFDNNRDLFPNFSKEEYHEHIVNYYKCILEDKIYNNEFDGKSFTNFYTNMIINYSSSNSYETGSN